MSEALAMAGEPLPTYAELTDFIESHETELDYLVGDTVHATVGADYDPQIERRRTLASAHFAAQTYCGDMRAFPRMHEEYQQTLRDRVQALSPASIKTLLYTLVVHDICKNQGIVDEMVAGGLDPKADHDQAFTALICDGRFAATRQRVMPGFDALPTTEQTQMQEVANISSNYAQLLQGEAPPQTAQGFHDALEHDPGLVEIKILESRFDIYGAAGDGSVSLTGTDAFERRAANMDQALTNSGLANGYDRIVDFYDKEIMFFTGINLASPALAVSFSIESLAELRRELRALAPLSCHLWTASPEAFTQLSDQFNAAHPTAQEILMHCLAEPNIRSGIHYYGPTLVRELTPRIGEVKALEYYAHIMQELMIVDQEARRRGTPGVIIAQLRDLIRDIQDGSVNPATTTMRYRAHEEGFVAEASHPALTSLEDLPVDDLEKLRGKSLLLVGEGGGSDVVQAAALAKLLEEQYGCRPLALVSARGRRHQVQDDVETMGTSLKRITPDTVAVGDWRYVEHTVAGEYPTWLLQSDGIETTYEHIEKLLAATGAEAIIGVDTGGDSLYVSEHPSFSGMNERDITPDRDYETMRALDAVAKAHPDVVVQSAIIAPGVDAPPYAREMLDAIGARRMLHPVGMSDRVASLYARWGMNGSRSEEGLYGKTPFAWLAALQGRFGVQPLPLPHDAILSATNPWRAYLSVTPAMAEVVFADLQRHADATTRR